MLSSKFKVLGSRLSNEINTLQYLRVEKFKAFLIWEHLKDLRTLLLGKRQEFYPKKFYHF